MTAGQPAYYKNVEDLQKAIDDYFKHCKENDEPEMITGLALYLGFTSRQALMNYQERAEFFDTIKKAKLRIEKAYELRNIKRGNAGDIFALKQFAWEDKSQTELTGKNGKDFVISINYPKTDEN